jgi:pyruvate,water dikinase
MPLGESKASIVAPMVAWFEELPEGSVSVAGAKGANLCQLKRAGLAVPNGFVVCASAFSTFLGQSGGDELIRARMRALSTEDDEELEHVSSEIRDMVLHGPLPSAIGDPIARAYNEMGESTPVAVRSSAISEDGENASFAGQHESLLNVSGVESVARAVRECWASFFAPRALFYRAERGDLADVRMAVVVQEMVPAEISGVTFTVDPVQKRRDHMVIEAVYGLGEGIMSGLLTPDHYVLDRVTGSLIREFVATQTEAILCDKEGRGVQHVRLSPEEGAKRVLNDDQLSGLREMGLSAEHHFGRPQDVEWCIHGQRLLLLQSRPISTL